MQYRIAKLVGPLAAVATTFWIVPFASATGGASESLSTLFTSTGAEVLLILVAAIGAAATVIAFIIGATVGVKKLRAWMK